MAEGSLAEGLGKVMLGGAVGFGLYLFITGLGFGGAGRGTGRGEGRGETSPPPGPPMPPPLPKDDRPLLYVLVEQSPQPAIGPDPMTRSRQAAGFRRLDLGATEMSPDDLFARMTDVLRRERAAAIPPISIDDLIARVKAGGRDDVRLISTGRERSGTFDDVLDALMAAGINHWKIWREAPADRKPGDPPKQPHWNGFRKVDAVGNPDKNGHFLVADMGSAGWNLSRVDGAKEPRVSGNARGRYGRVDLGRGAYR